ncbi:hypothetical protein [Pontibacillus salipaludis]|nr:hypothetical protein [Pontibacillus salipaludis]
MLRVFLLYGGTMLAVGIVLFLRFIGPGWLDRNNCVLCGQEIEKDKQKVYKVLFNAAMEEETKCKNCEVNQRR